MPAYDFGFGYAPQAGYGRTGGASPGAYGYRPNYGVRNPFDAWRPTELEYDYYANNPQATFGRYLGANQVSGPEGVAPNFRAFLENWLPDAYKQWEGTATDNPDLGFADWIGGQDPMNQYEMTNPYARNLRAGYRTRYLRR